MRFGQSVYPRGVGGRGGTHFAPYPEHSREVMAEKNGSIPGLKSHFLQKEAATRDGIAAFLFLCLIPVYALEGYWTARVRVGFESLVTSEFRFGNEDSGSAGQRKGGRERLEVSHPSAQNAEGCGTHGCELLQSKRSLGCAARRAGSRNLNRCLTVRRDSTSRSECCCRTRQ